MSLERQIKYNVEIDTDEQVDLNNYWTFLIVNTPQEIQRITQRILRTLSDREKFRRADSYHELAENLIKGSKGLHYKAFTLESTAGQLSPQDKRGIYDQLSKFRPDRDLTRTKTDIWFEEVYIPKLQRESRRL
jgi:transcription initiation factor IIE alpha subunit